MGEGGVPRGQEYILVKNAPHFWALALAFVVQVPTSLSTPLEGGGRTGGAPWGRGEGDFHLMYSWSLKSGHFKQKSPLSKSPKIMMLIIYVSLLAQR